jgi:hypothetical protein
VCLISQESKCRPPAKHASQLTEIFLDTRQSTSFEILEVSLLVMRIDRTTFLSSVYSLNNGVRINLITLNP